MDFSMDSHKNSRSIDDMVSTKIPTLLDCSSTRTKTINRPLFVSQTLSYPRHCSCYYSSLYSCSCSCSCSVLFLSLPQFLFLSLCLLSSCSCPRFFKTVPVAFPDSVLETVLLLALNSFFLFLSLYLSFFYFFFLYHIFLML